MTAPRARCQTTMITTVRAKPTGQRPSFANALTVRSNSCTSLPSGRP
ncbi:hypothetical protein [Longispora fulva]|uniref:Uncharacterized protein n=1 Tax=Longispora fulva TaxID=619741 RepID=A0A8J7GPJ1_9ACTN|nr:hypothetical protein [Longispora fulva]MBG6136589.1 hypothetical protein [Longispora fulva]